MKRFTFSWIVAVLAWLFAGGVVQAQPLQRLVPFDEFVSSVGTADFGLYSIRDEVKVRRDSDFEAMREHILSMYEGVKVAHSFVMDSQVFDCVPIDQQPSVRQLGLGKALREPPQPVVAEEEAGAKAFTGVTRLPSPLTLGLQDSFGNAVRCEQGTIPLRRITLEELSRFETLEKFFKKTPTGDPGLDLGDAKAAPSAVHKYAHASQSIKNYGGDSWLNIWNPTVNGSVGQIFSLSQHWYVGGSGKSLQTVEGGWQAYPAKYGTSNSVLFIYWTADNYNKTGCYNLDCPAFVQTNSNWYLGGTWTNSSSLGGQQWEFQMQWQFTGGNWWLFLQGNGSFEAVGYYPGSVYRGGQLTRYATRVDYGGETVGTTSWPQMGSGVLASSGYQQAAYQRYIFYLDSTVRGTFTSLKPSQTSPRCYTLSYTPSSLGGLWHTYFFFGGPGGKC